MNPVRLILHSVLLLSISHGAYAAAFGNPNGSGGTVYALGSDVIKPSDANDFMYLSVPESMQVCHGKTDQCETKDQLSAHSNIEVRKYYEIKQKKWLYSKFYIFEARYGFGDRVEIQVSYDDGKRGWQEAYRVGLEYAKLLGHIPPDLRAATHSITIHNYYNGLMGGSNNIIIFEKRGAEHIEKGSIEEALFHEATHNYFNEMIFKKQNPHYGLWKQAQSKDDDYISYYAKSNDYEDIAESLITYYAAKYKPERIGELKQTVLNAIPHRVRFFEGVNLNLTHYDRSVDPNSSFQIINAATQQPLTVVTDSQQVLAASEPVDNKAKNSNTLSEQLWQLRPQTNQQFGSSNWYQLRSNSDASKLNASADMTANRCMDIINGGPNDQHIQLKGCGNYSGQLYSLKPVGHNRYQLLPLWQKNLTRPTDSVTPALNCLTVTNIEGEHLQLSQNNETSKLTVAPCDNSLQQTFILKTVD